MDVTDKTVHRTVSAAVQ